MNYQKTCKYPVQSVGQGNVEYLLPPCFSGSCNNKECNNSYNVFVVINHSLKIDIIKHPSEVDGKSTSAHAKVLAPDDVSIYTYPCIPDYPRDGSVRHYKGGVMVT
jgi:hypothetical protein